MKLTYWYSRCPHDSDVYSIRTKTKKEALEKISQAYRSEEWPAPRRVNIEYQNAFDLMGLCSEEDHHFWEAA